MSTDQTTNITAVSRSHIKRYFSNMGPSWIAGAIAAGPATMASLITAGVFFGYSLLWVVILSAILGASAQYLAMRLGLFTETGIVAAVETHLGDSWAWILVADVVIAAGLAQLVIMNTVADVSATITGLDARIWGVIWAVILVLGLAGRGYHFIEIFAKILVSLVVIAFILSLFVVPIDYGTAATGIIPSLPGGLSSAAVVAAILGGAVHITLITMQSYTMRAREWTTRDYGLATFDIGASMLVAFGIYSLAIFLVVASVLHGEVEGTLRTVAAAEALGPLAGNSARILFLLGLWGAAVSTLGGNTIVPPYLIADKLGWGTSVEDNRYRILIAAVALLSGLGAFIGGEVLGQLVLVLAIGTVGTPFALLIVLYLLNSDAVPESNSISANILGILLVIISGSLAVNFVRGQLAQGIGALSGFVLAFAVILGIAMLGLVVLFIRREL